MDSAAGNGHHGPGEQLEFVSLAAATLDVCCTGATALPQRLTGQEVNAGGWCAYFSLLVFIISSILLMIHLYIAHLLINQSIRGCIHVILK